MKQLTYLAAAVALLAACSPKAGKTTKVVGAFGEDAPEFVEISMGEALDTTIYVQDGRFEAVIPTNLTTMAVIDAGSTPITFIADGSTITIDPDAGTAVSSDKKGPNARYGAYNEWMEQFMADYREKMTGFGDDEDAAEAYYNEAIGQFVPEHIEATLAEEEQSEQAFSGKRQIIIAEDEKSILSDREADILPLIAQGLTSQQIADKLFLSLPTIKWYRRRLLMKFDARNTAEMLSKAREAGML